MNRPVKFSTKMSWGFFETSFYLSQPTKKTQQNNNKTKPNQKQQKENKTRGQKKVLF